MGTLAKYNFRNTPLFCYKTAVVEKKRSWRTPLVSSGLRRSDEDFFFGFIFQPVSSAVHDSG